MNLGFCVLRLFVCMLLLTVVGCAEAPIPEFGVTGKVTLDESPLANATISFVPQGTTDAYGASATTNESGEYTVTINEGSDGLAAGTYSVSVSTYQEGNDEVDPPIPTIEERIPKKYNSETELTAEVKEEMNVFDFALDSDGEIEQF